MSDMLLISTGDSAGRTCDRAAKERKTSEQAMLHRKGGWACRMKWQPPHRPAQTAVATESSGPATSDKVTRAVHREMLSGPEASGSETAWTCRRGGGGGRPHNLQIATLTGHATGCAGCRIDAVPCLNAYRQPLHTPVDMLLPAKKRTLRCTFHGRIEHWTNDTVTRIHCTTDYAPITQAAPRGSYSIATLGGLGHPEV